MGLYWIKTKQVWQLIDWTWIPNEYQSKNNQMNEKGIECTWVVNWLLHGKQRLVNEHRIVSCMSQSKSIKHDNQSINEKITHVRPPPKPNLFLHKLISWIPLFEIMKFIRAYFKTFKNHGRCEKRLAKEQMTTNFTKNIIFKT